MNLGKLVSSLKLLRPVFLIGGLAMNLFGAALAYHIDSRIDWTSFICFQLIVVSVQLSGHAANDIADIKTDAVNRNRTWFSGGSGVLPEGRVSRRGAMWLCATFAALAILGSSTFTILLGWSVTVMILILAGTGVALQYSLDPLKLAYRGLGEVFVLFVYGSVCADAAFIVQHGSWENLALVATVPLMIQVMAVMLLTEYPDIEADSSAGKKNLAVRMGSDRTRLIAMLTILAGAVVSLLGIFGGMSELSVVAISLTFAAEAAVIAVVLRLLRAAKLGYNWLTSASIGFLVIIILISAATF